MEKVELFLETKDGVCRLIAQSPTITFTLVEVSERHVRDYDFTALLVREAKNGGTSQK